MPTNDGQDELEPTRRDLLGFHISPELAELHRRMNEQGIPVASQLEAIRLIAAVKEGHSPYMLGREMGMSRVDARAGAPTALALEITRFLGADDPGYDDTFEL